MDAALEPTRSPSRTDPALAAGHRFPGEAERKRGSRIARMFDRIAPTYDLLNRVLSGRSDVRWRKRAVAHLRLSGRERVLDACTGTGDVAIALAESGAAHVDATDFSPAMVRLGREKAAAFGDRVAFEVADTTALPFPDATFDGASVAFGVRNLHDLDAGLRELARVLKRGGRLVILEFSLPRNRVVRTVYLTYFLVVFPLIGNLVSGGADNAYAYLPRSVLAFPEPDALAARLRAAGFREVAIEPLSLGIATLHVATR